MMLYNIKTRQHYESPEYHHIIDLENITSVSPISPTSYTGYNIGLSHVDFCVYLKVGHPVRITIETGHLSPCTEEDIAYAEQERQRLIEAWKNVDN